MPAVLVGGSGAVDHEALYERKVDNMMAAVGLGAAHKDGCRNNDTVDDFTAPILPAAQLFLCRNVCVVAQCSYLFGTHFFGVIADYRDVPSERLRYATASPASLLAVARLSFEFTFPSMKVRFMFALL